MKRILESVLIFAVLVFCMPAFAQEQEKQPSLEERIEEEADRLQTKLDLEDWQAFYVDSTLKHDLTAMQAEYEKLQKMKVENSNSYQAVQDKWMDAIDASYKKIFTEEQWAKYLKTGVAKEMKKREKRRKKAQN